VILTLTVLALSACGRKVKASLPPALPPTLATAPAPAAPEPPVRKPDAPAGTAAPRAMPSRHELEGLASFYAEPYGRRTANGEIFDTYKDMTAAHRTLPFNTMIRVTNQLNSESVDVRINDRGPFVHGRVIDLSVAAAEKIGMVQAGVVPVKITILQQGYGRRVRAKPVKSSRSP
jgi:rare lipoprotein A